MATSKHKTTVLNTKPPCPHAETSYFNWCDKCAKLSAGKKPNPKFKAGDFVVVDRDGDVGVVRKVKMVLFGTATPTPSWQEEVDVDSLSGRTTCPASFLSRLVRESSVPVRTETEET